MIRVVLLSLVLLAGTAVTASACCLLGAQGRPHGGNTAVKAYMFRHGLKYHPNRHGRPFTSSHYHPY